MMKSQKKCLYVAMVLALLMADGLLCWRLLFARRATTEPQYARKATTGPKYTPGQADYYGLNNIESKKFNAKDWKFAVHLTSLICSKANGERIYMVRDLCTSQKLEGATFTEVLNLLGNPDRASDTIVKWEVHRNACGLGSIWLFLKFSEGRVKHAWLASDSFIGFGGNGTTILKSSMLSFAYTSFLR
jgi:hypothetical protein